MKKKLITLISIMLLAIAAQAAVSLNFNLGVMVIDPVTPTTVLPDTRLVQIIVSTTDTYFGGASNTGWFNGTTGGADDIIIATGYIDSGTAMPGGAVIPASFDLTGGITAGDPIMVRWFRNIGTTATAGDVGGYYGTYRDPAALDGGDFGWVVPADGQGGNINFFTVSTGFGSVPDVQGLSDTLVAGVPEPSTYAAIFGLVALGFAYLRRRK